MNDRLVEVMARAVHEAHGDDGAYASSPAWEALHSTAQDGYRADAEAALAALEAEGWGLTDTREVERLREAIRAELTHGGIVDCIAHATTIIGASLNCNQDLARGAAERLDRDRDEFYRRMAEALSSVPVEEEERP